jgi:hypothetical protein
VGPNATTQPQPIFRGGVDLVTLDVTVVDNDGKPVRGLKPSDFVGVTLEGRRASPRAGFSRVRPCGRIARYGA